MSSMAIIEFQASAGNWVRVCDCANKPAIIKSIFDATFQSRPSISKLRAIDAQTKQLIDISFRM